MVPAGNKAKGLSLVNHTAKNHHHHYHHVSMSIESHLFRARVGAYNFNLRGPLNKNQIGILREVYLPCQ